MRFNHFYITLILLTLFNLYSCKSDSATGDEDNKIENEVLDPNSSLNTVFDDKIFSIPSPVQTSMMIRNLGLPYNGILLNPTENLSEYNTIFKQALNLGIYGTDLGYVSLYNKADQCLKYLASIQRITEKLGLNKAFDVEILSRFENNLSNQDSMMMIAADAFRLADNYLKNTNRKAVSTLILTGGWLESLYLACELNQIKSSKELISRIGEQDLTLSTLIEALTEYNDNQLNNELISDLKELKFYFKKIEFNYTYRKPTTDVKKKVTTLNHTVEVKVDSDVINLITMKLRSIREKIIE